MRYAYTDFDGDRLIIENTDWPANTASVSVHGNAVFVPAAEAPKAAQAILDAAEAKGVVLTGLPEVKARWGGGYEAQGFTSYHQSDLTVMELELKALTAIWLRRKADAKAKDKHLGLDWGKVALEKKAAEAKKAHDDLRTSPIALKALALYNRSLIGIGPYKTWDAANSGRGVDNATVKEYIGYAEVAEAKEKEAAERLAARRLDIYKELGGVFFSNFEPQSPIGYAIDRIIALEDK